METEKDLASSPVMLTLKETTEKLNAAGIRVSYQVVRRLVLSNELPAVRFGRQYFCNWSKIKEKLKNGGSPA